MDMGANGGAYRSRRAEEVTSTADRRLRLVTQEGGGCGLRGGQGPDGHETSCIRGGLRVEPEPGPGLDSRIEASPFHLASNGPGLASQLLPGVEPGATTGGS